MFYFITKMTVQVMTIADRRTSTMIHVNAIMISAVVALLVRKLEEQRDPLVPTLVLLAVALAADGPGLQKAMVDQLYFSRSVINARAKALRVTYDVFLYGLAVSLAAFGFVLVRR